jgi:hypothetical protein
MTPPDLGSYFSASSAVVGTLIGLLFVSITLRYDAILGPSAPPSNRSLAAALVQQIAYVVFSALLTALMRSWQLLQPDVAAAQPKANPDMAAAQPKGD